MSIWVFCNSCFQQPKANGCRFILTNCGHVVCEMCLRKGSMDVCCICKAQCHTVFLSDKMDPDLKALFTQPEKVCERYLKEFVQHTKLKAYVGHVTQRKEQLQRELAENKSSITKLESTFPQRLQTPRSFTPSASREFVSTPSMKSAKYSSVPQSRPSSNEMTHKMEIDGRPNSSGKSDSSMGPPRLSLISPPRDGRMGTVPYRGAGKLGFARATAHSAPVQQIGLSSSPSSGTLSHRGGFWDSPNYRAMLSHPSTPSSLQTSVLRPPITISSLLMRP
ncbi:probable E3 SUMO-protein ligase RNF212 isoform X2 [Narcine bancroftii]|uniref:probable E3 SUMO-protein ligase RNF212 isoform X2 n=1 Tax=Narcine bancroftii TaxID=1343680 RepID=UPI0038317C70